MKFNAKICTCVLVFTLSTFLFQLDFKVNASSSSNALTGAGAIVGPNSKPISYADDAVGALMKAWVKFNPANGTTCTWQWQKPEIKEVLGIMLGMLYVLPDCQYGTFFALNDGTDKENPMCLAATAALIFGAGLAANIASEAAVSAIASTGIGCSIAGNLAFHAGLIASLVAATGILQGTASLAASSFKICDGGVNIVTPMAYPDSQIKFILQAMGINPTVENIIDKYEKICVQHTSSGEYKWMKYGECWSKNAVKICVYAPDNIDPSLALCARVSSTCPCAMSIQRGLIDGPTYAKDSNGVYKTNADGTLKITDDGTFQKRSGDYYKQHAGIHCKALRHINKPPLTPTYTGIIDDVCHTWSGYSKNRVTLTAGVVQCIANTFENLFKKPLIYSTNRGVLNDAQQTRYNAYNYDYQLVDDVLTLTSRILNNNSTDVSTLSNKINSIINNTAFTSFSERGITIPPRTYSFFLPAVNLSNAIGSIAFYSDLNIVSSDLALLGNTIDSTRINYLDTALRSNIQGITAFQSLQGGVAAIIFLVLILYFINIGFKMINGQFPLESSTIIPIFINFALIYYFAIGSAWKDMVLNIVMDIANGFATFAFSIPASSVKITDKCNFSEDYYIPSSNAITTQSNPCGMGISQITKTTYTCNTPSFSITQSVPCQITAGVTQMYQCGSSLPQQTQCANASQQSYICTTNASSLVKNTPCSTQNNTIQTSSTEYSCTNISALCHFPPNSTQQIVTYDANRNPKYGCKRGPFIPPLQYEQIYKPVIYDGMNSNGTISPTWLMVYCVNANNSSDTKPATLLPQNPDGSYRNLVCSLGAGGERYVMEDGYRTSELNKMGIVNPQLVTTDNNYNIMHTAFEITNSDGRIIDILSTIANEQILLHTSSLKYQHKLLIESVRAAANRQERYYPILKPFGPSGSVRDMNYVGIFDTLDCKAMSYFGYTPDDTEDVTYVKLMSGMLTSFPFGWIVILIMVIMGVSMISAVGNLVQKYLVCFCGLMILFFISPLVFTCKLFPETSGYFDEWLDKFKGFLISIPLSFFMMGLLIALYDYALYGSPGIYSQYNFDGTLNSNYIKVFNDNGTINKDCANNGNLSTAPLVCLAYYFINNVEWIGIPFTSIAIPRPHYDGAAFLYIFKTLVISLLISFGASSIIDILDKLFQSLGLGADTSLEGSMVNSANSLRDQAGARAGATAKLPLDIAKDVGSKAKHTGKKIGSSAASSAISKMVNRK